MSYTDRAVGAVQAAEHALRAELRTIIVEAVAAEAFADVASIARMAEALANLTRQFGSAAEKQAVVPGGRTAYGVRIIDFPGGDEPIPADWTPTAFEAHLPQSVRAASEGPVEKVRLRGSSRGDQYPRFLREGDRLVKIAWSKRKHGPYEHKAPRAVIQALVNAVQRQIGEGKLFQAGTLLPLKDALHEEYPSYQSYLALSWLRDVGVISKKGRDGYVLKPNTAKTEQLERLWLELPGEESDHVQSEQATSDPS
jgi:hypothetical protein